MGCGGGKAKVTDPEQVKPGSKSSPESHQASPKKELEIPSPAKVKSSVTAEGQFSASSFVQNKLAPINDDYVIGETLGRGAFAEVKSAIFRPTKDARAIKIIHKVGLAMENLDAKHKLRELKVLKELDHPNILRVYELYEDKSRYYIVMEFCAGGDLFSRLHEAKKFTEIQVGQLMYQLLSAVSYCHERKVIHRDLKPENILLEDKTDRMTIKISDFGSSSFLDVKKKLSGVYGSAYYVAPEVLKEAYNEKCDIWSCGIILYVLLTGRPPYPGRTEKEILNCVYAGALDISGLLDVSAEARDLANLLLNRNYRLRTSATAALTHPFIQRSRSADPTSGAQLSTILTNLKAFNNSCKLKDAIHTFIATQVITQADMKELRDSFRSIDKNGDGRISKEELLEKYRNTMPASMAEQEVTEIMERVDTNHSGFIDYSEFLHASLDKAKHLSHKNMETTFKMFDKDNSGKISASELRAMLSSTSVDDQTWNQIISEVDSNGDGEIDLREFESMITKHF